LSVDVVSVDRFLMSLRAGVWFMPAVDAIVPGDYDGDGRTDMAVYRPGTTPGAQGIFYVQESTAGFAAMPWGITGDVPTASAYVR
jgi:hypothetical protein